MADLSAGGLRFFANEPIELGTYIEFQLFLPGRQIPYVLRAEVVRVWDDPTGAFTCGTVFVEMTPDRQAELDELVQFVTKQQSAEQGGPGGG